jgi:hypothetical protein
MDKMISTKKWLHNKYVLYSTLAVSCIFLLWLLLANKFGLIFLFALIAYIIYCFNRNMIIVLGLSVIITYIATLVFKVREGFTEGSGDGTVADNIKNNLNEKKTNIQNKIANAKATLSTDSTTGSTTTGSTTTGSTTTGSTTTGSTTTGSTTTDGTTTTTDGTSTVQGMNNISSNKKYNRIDYASTVEDAYDDLNKILGPGGISRLTTDTSKLMDQQLQLADAMKNMGPLIESAKSLMKGFDFNNLDGIAKMAKNLYNPQS